MSLIRAATKRLFSFGFKAGNSFRRRADSDKRVEEVGLESSGVLVSSGVASDSSLDEPWYNPSFVVNMTDRDLFLARCGMDSIEDNRLALSVVGQLGIFAL